MGRVRAASVPVLAMAVLAYGCGGRAQSDGVNGGSEGEPSGPIGQGGGGGARATKHCETVRGELAYGPIGEPHPLPLTTVSFADCLSCGGVTDIIGFRTAAGYGFMWLVPYGSTAPGPNLFSWTASSNFKGGEPLPLLSARLPYAVAVVPAPNGFVAATCSVDSKPQWIELNRDFEVAEGSGLAAPEAPCAQSIFWTGQVYLTAFADSRGLVVASLDAQGVLVAEKVLADEGDTPVVARFSKNADRVLFVFSKNWQRAWYGVVDLWGMPLGAVQPFGEEATSYVSSLAVVARGDGWWVASDGMATNQSGVQLTGISGSEKFGESSECSTGTLCSEGSHRAPMVDHCWSRRWIVEGRLVTRPS
jgi:hypothetical protein